jgi:hypothetical protein
MEQGSSHLLRPTDQRYSESDLANARGMLEQCKQETARARDKRDIVVNKN